MELLGNNPFTVISSNIFAAITAMCIAWLAFRLGQENRTYPVNWLICILGALIGWIVGIFGSPYSQKEAQIFLTLGQAVTAFLSGYVVSKLDRFLESALYSEGSIKPESWLRVCLFVASLLLTMIIVFINRLYFNVHS